MKWIIAGGRKFIDYEFLKEVCDDVIPKIDTSGDIQIISGCAGGADTLGIKYAEDNDYDLIKMPADWNKHGKSAGPIRNSEMADVGDCLIAFWDGRSRGTKNMINTATNKGLYVKVIRFKP